MERNYHVFFQVLNSQAMKAKYSLKGPEEYLYLNQSQTYKVPGIDDAEDFDVMIHCMQNIGFSEKEINEVIDIVVGIINLGNVEFES